MKSPKEEFLEVLANYQGILHKVNLIYFRNKTDREDNFQEIVYQLWKSYPRLRNKESIGSWFYAVSINTSISRLRNKSRIEYRGELPESLDSIDIDAETSREDNFRLLLRGIRNLNEIDKSIMLLYLEEKSYDEIAAILGMSKTNIGARISRAKETLKKILNILDNGNQ
jgi:RNA polymerase sigma-70 factor, ECF subfamily